MYRLIFQKLNAINLLFSIIGRDSMSILSSPTVEEDINDFLVKHSDSLHDKAKTSSQCFSNEKEVEQQSTDEKCESPSTNTSSQNNAIKCPRCGTHDMKIYQMHQGHFVILCNSKVNINSLIFF